MDTLMVNNPNGVPIDCTRIADLWHIAMGLDEQPQDAVLEVWHQAHALQAEVLRLRAIMDVQDHLVARKNAQRDSFRRWSQVRQLSHELDRRLEPGVTIYLDGKLEQDAGAAVVSRRTDVTLVDDVLRCHARND